MGTDYAAALEYLYSLTNYEHKLATQYAGQLFDLSRMERLLDAMGRPEREFRSVHVAGTKGKGSTAAMIASALRCAGLRTGLFSSPHLHTFRERIQVDSEPISEGAFVAHLRRLRPLFDTLAGLTTFEASQAIAFDYFVGTVVAWVVVEVGLGGRLDTTNVIQPEVAVITPVSHDHMLVLGNTLEAIAREKAGIIKSHTPVVSAPQPEEAANVIRHTAEHLEAPLTTVGVDWTYALHSADWDGQRFTVYGPGVTYADLFIPLLGPYQLTNATTAVATLRLLQERGLTLPEEAVRAGLRTVRWPARLEILSREPLLVADGAHNGESMRRLVEALEAHFPGRRRVAVFASLADKDLPRMLEALLPTVDAVILTRTQHPRAADPEELAGRRVLFEGGTFSGHPASMLAGKLMLEHLARHESTIYPQLAAAGERLRQGIEQAFADRGVVTRCTGWGNEVVPGSSLIQVHFPFSDDVCLDTPDLLWDPRLSDAQMREQVLKLGLLLQDVHVSHGLGAVSTAHSGAHEAQTLRAFAWVAEQIAAARGS